MKEFFKKGQEEKPEKMEEEKIEEEKLEEIEKEYKEEKQRSKSKLNSNGVKLIGNKWYSKKDDYKKGFATSKECNKYFNEVK